MEFIIFLLAVLILFTLFMIKQAFENNIREHSVRIYGDVTEQLRIFFISDVHLREINSDMIRKINTADAVIIGGDFCDGRTSFERIKYNTALLQTLGPVYFVWGNNDHEVGEIRLRKFFSQVGVEIIENSAQLLQSKNRVWLSAINDTSTMKYDFEKAFKKCGKEDITIFVSHNPQIFYRVKNYFKPQLMMGGHLHGGQIRFWKFGVHPHGSFSLRDGIPTLISNGYGTTLVPVRLGAKPECHIITIEIEQNTPK
ncbi:metallophosphoesterase [Solibacillus sp. CAU 1738]|uniref:metallophosphoesterase n=1 Tax=Solibacillus sp. CAU 1738 TaxID=3140363 RepID=UPI003261D311